MFLQGSGVGFFQVAYFDIATATIPRAQRGVAGSLVMMTRTVGVVTGATVLMLVFRTMRAGAEAAAPAKRRRSWRVSRMRSGCRRYWPGSCWSRCCCARGGEPVSLRERESGRREAPWHDG